MAAKRRRRPKCGFTRPAPRPQKGRTAGGRIKPGFRISKGGRVVKKRKR